MQTSITLIVTSKLEKSRGVPQVVEPVFPLNETKQNISYTSPAIHGLSQEPVQTHGPILQRLLWTQLFHISAESQDHVGQENGWLYLKRRTELGIPLVAQGLRVNLPVQGAWVLSLVGELRSHMPGATILNAATVEPTSSAALNCTPAPQ